MQVDPSAVARLLEQLAREIHGESDSCILSPGQWAILRCLKVAERSARTTDRIASHLGISERVAARAVSALVRMKLASLPAKADGVSGARIDLTEGGEAMLGRDPINRITKVIEAMAPDDRGKVGMLLQALYAALSDQRCGRMS